MNSTYQSRPVYSEDISNDQSNISNMNTSPAESGAEIVKSSPKDKKAKKPKDTECGLNVTYQPIVQPMFNKVIAYEAQVNLVDKELGFIPYEIFMPIAEKSEVITMLEHWILKEVCSMIQKMMKKEIDFDYISIGVSSKYLKKKNYIPNLLKILNEMAVPPEKICLVIPESSFNGETDVFIEKMLELKREGFKMAICEYGANYVPLTILDSIPVDVIILDSTVTSRIFIDKKTEENIASIIRHINRLDIDLIAKEVDDEIIKYKLMMLGCKKMQGDLYGKIVKEKDILNPKPYKSINAEI